MKRSPEQQVDQSAKFAFSFFVASAGLWLLAAALLAYIAAAKLTNPLFLASWEVFTYGKIKISQANAFVYGWGGNSIFAVSLWIIARLSQSPVRGFNLPHFWRSCLESRHYLRITWNIRRSHVGTRTT